MSSITKSLLLQDFANVLQNAGPAIFSPGAYDTAWVARIPQEQNPRLSAFLDALTWLTHNQHADGSWGEGSMAERLLATLAAVIALTEKGQRQRDALQAQRGLAFIWRSLPQLQAATVLPIGFELLLGTLVKEGQAIGLSLPRWLVDHFEVYRQEKMRLMGQMGQERLRNTSTAFSLEFLGRDITVPAEVFVLDNGSVGISPAATASMYRSVTDPAVRQRMLEFLQSTRMEGEYGAGWCNVTRCDLFEVIWILYNLSLCGHAHNPELQGSIARHLDLITRSWKDTGVAVSSEFETDDLDSSSLGMAVLYVYGIHRNPEVLEKYWRETHFATYPMERDPSISNNIHALDGLLSIERTPHVEMRIKQTLEFLHEARQGMPFWMDKWHVSPYYPTGHAICAAAAIDRELVMPAIDWLGHTQLDDGSWGFEVGTSEETSYAVQALIVYAQEYGWTPRLRRMAQTGAEFLRRGYRPFITDELPLWIGKNRYTPYLVVRASILSALIMAESHGL